MSVVVVGLEHKLVPLDLLERVAVSGEDAPEVLAGLRRRENLSEVVVLSTCLRTEVYAVVDRFHDAVYQLQEFFAKRAEIGPRGPRVGLHRPLRRRRRDAPVLCRRGPRIGRARRVRGPRPGAPGLGALPRRAASRAGAGRRSSARPSRPGSGPASETAISRGTTSFAHAAVELAAAERLDGGLAGRDVAVVGCGRARQRRRCRRWTRCRLRAAASHHRGPNRNADRSRCAGRRVRSDAVSVVRSFDALDAVDRAEPMSSSAPSTSTPPSSARRGSRPPARDRAARLWWSTSACPATSIPRPPSSRASPCSAWTSCAGAVSAATDERQAEVDAVLAIVAEELDRYRATVRGSRRRPGHRRAARSPGGAAGGRARAPARPAAGAERRGVGEGRRGEQGRAGQGAPPPDDAPEGDGRDAAWRAARRGAALALRPVGHADERRARPAWPDGRTLRLATRGSPLARRQSDMVAHLLVQARPGSSSSRSWCAPRATAGPTSRSSASAARGSS